MLTFFSDLDNTLVYSNRHEITSPKRVAEYLNGEIQSWMTQKTYDFFRDRRDVLLIPVTTRTIAQFKRLSIVLDDLAGEYALVSNGGLLLKNGVSDPVWRDETMALADVSLPALKEAASFLHLTYPELNVRTVDDIMVYTVSDNAPTVAAALRSAFADANITICCAGRKVYCLPTAINKGTAVRRFARKMGIQTWMAAGDTEMDLPMLDGANPAFVPAGLAGKVSAFSVAACCGDMVFSDFICDCISKMG